MKVRITPNGDVEFDVSNGEGQAALDLIRAIQNQMRASTNVVDEAPRTYFERLEKLRQENFSIPEEPNNGCLPEVIHTTPMSSRLASLSRTQRATYEALIEFDSEDGVHVSALGTLLETSDGAINHRLALLEHRGLVTRVTRGHYRAVQQ